MKPTSLIRRLSPTVCGCIVVFLGFLACLYAASGGSSRPLKRILESSIRQGALHFAVADFDGDLQPDVAMVRVFREGSPSSEYHIDLKLSSGTPFLIQLTAPSGGLEISPEDVNGDNLTDLVLTSSLDSRFVAVYLNEGSGRFHVADASAYPEAGKRSQSKLDGQPTVSDEFVLHSERSDNEAVIGLSASAHGLASEFWSGFSRTAYVRVTVGFDGDGRAPPFFTPEYSFMYL